MTTLFEEADNTNPPSPSELLDASIKGELDGPRKVSTNSTNQTDDELNSGESGGVPQEASDSRNLGDSFTSFVDDGNHLSSGVRVVHVQTVPDATNTNNSGQVNTSSGTLYAVGGGGQLQQVIAPGDSTIGTVSVDGGSQDGTRYTYYPTVQATDGNQTGQFYVMMSPQEVIPVTGNNAPRIIAPRSQSLATKVETSRSTRDERRRATHNEVERRRRDKINTWIMKIAAVVPDCQMDQSKQGTSKGGVLSKALDHIVKLRQENERLRENIKEQERVLVENQVLRQQVEKLRQENSILQANLHLRQSEDKHLEDD